MGIYKIYPEQLSNIQPSIINYSLHAAYHIPVMDYKGKFPPFDHPLAIFPTPNPTPDNQQSVLCI